MPLSQGTLLGSCEILEPLGSGGMGEVWRGRDSRLGRDVAVKALPEAFAHDEERLTRFEREAQALASLNHPNVAIIHEMKEVAGSKYLILELVEGETLAERISRGPIPVNETLDIAAQITRALGAAHDKGIVHRDLKPANVKVTPQGRVKVLDFGLAKIYEPSSAPPNLSNSPTFLGDDTEEGIVLGTAAYMSPEQARGKDVDRRTDVWAFGCVLYEMLSGRQPFPNGETFSDTLAGILIHEPDLQALPKSTPPKIRALIERCLRKDERKRIRDVGDARITLEETRTEVEANAAAAVRPAFSKRREIAFASIAAVSVLAAIGFGARLFLSATPQPPAVRLDLPTPIGMPNSFYLSPDGRKLAFVTTPVSPARIWVRSLDSATAESIASTEGINTPGSFFSAGNFGQNYSLFWSADSENIGFVAEGKLKRVAATGGPATVLATLPATGNYFGSWSGNTILLAADATAGPLLRVPSSGGQPTPATELDKSRKETSHRFPHFLPDGRHFLYLATGADARDRIVYVGSLNSKDRHPLTGIAAEAKYSNGHLVFIRDGALMAQPFDTARLELTGEAFNVADKFAPPTALTWSFSASLNGLLAYRSSTDASTPTSNMELVWYDRNSAQLGVAASEGEYIGPEPSPDAKFVAFSRTGDIWWVDIEKKVTTKLTIDPAPDQNPRWSPNGKAVMFDSMRDGSSGIYQRDVGVTGTDKLIFKAEGAKTLSLSDWSRDGKYLAYVADNDIYALALSGDAKGEQPRPIQVTKTAFTEMLPRISPDSRWIAYVSNKSGQAEVYVQSFPEPGVEQIVSQGAGGGFGGGAERAQPHWNRDGTELFYFVGNPVRFMSVKVKPVGTSLNASAPMQVITHPRPRNPFSSVFSISTDGRFLLQLATGGTATPGTQATTQPAASQAPITVIVGWSGNHR